MRIDSISVENEDEATKLMVHHLHIAAMLFEATYDDAGTHADELILHCAPIEIEAMQAFVRSLVAKYEEMDL